MRRSRLERGDNALWILGLSIILAAFSYLDWLAHETSRTRRELFKKPGWTIPFSLGMLLVCLGMGLGSDVAWWERALWAVLAVSFAWQTVAAALELRRVSARPRDVTPTDEPATSVAKTED